MQRLFVLIAVLLSLAACSTNPLSKVDNLSDKNLGEVSKYLFRYAELSSPDETDKLRHWKLTNEMIYSDDTGFIIKDRLGNLSAYCSTKNGKLEKPISRPRGATEVVCLNQSTDKPIFIVVGGVEECRSLSPDNSHYLKGAREIGCKVWADAFSWKTPGTRQDIYDSFRLENEGFVTYHKPTPEEILQKQRNADQQRQIAAVAEEKRQLALAEAAREKAKREMPLIKTVGQKICRTIGITQRQAVGQYLGKTVYTDPVSVQARVTGFTENVSGDKIQLRIAGMQAGNENLDRIDGEVMYQNGGVIWDNAANWGLCN
jgi:hypothetical protein